MGGGVFRKKTWLSQLKNNIVTLSTVAINSYTYLYSRFSHFKVNSLGVRGHEMSEVIFEQKNRR